MGFLSLIYLPSPADALASTSAWTLPIFADIWPVLAFVLGLGIVFWIVNKVFGIFG